MKPFQPIFILNLGKFDFYQSLPSTFFGGENYYFKIAGTHEYWGPFPFLIDAIKASQNKPKENVVPFKKTADQSIYGKLIEVDFILKRRIK